MGSFSSGRASGCGKSGCGICGARSASARSATPRIRDLPSARGRAREPQAAYGYGYGQLQWVERAFFQPLTADNVYLQTSGSQVQWSTDGSSFTTLNGLTLAGPGSANQFTFQLSGDVHRVTLPAPGGADFGGTGNSAAGFIGPGDFSIDGSLYTKGGDLTINDVQGVDLAANMVVSTQISAGSSAATRVTSPSRSIIRTCSTPF